MRVQAALAVMAAFCILSPSAVADEFGPRFWSKAPAGLGDFTAPAASVENVAMDEQIAKDLQNIMPAAGEEESQTQDNVPSKAESSGTQSH